MKKIIFLLFAISISFACWSQQTEMIAGREFIVHKVTKGETVYGISKKYDVPQDTIFAYNQTASKGIKADQVLKFPSKKGMTTKPTTQGGGNQTSANDNTEYIKHVVGYGETLYGIARKYNTTVEAIEKANPSLKNGLKAEETILIPVIKNDGSGNNHQVTEDKNPVNDNSHNNHNENNGQTTNTNTNVENDHHTENKKPVDKDCNAVPTNKSTFNIALILPFKGGTYNSSKIATEFYYGFKIAVDSVAEAHHKTIKLFVMNSAAQNDSDKTENQYDFDKLKDMDMIVGPLYASNIKPIASFAKENNIPIVSPFTKSENLLADNPCMIKITPSDKTLASRTVNYFNNLYPNCNFILVRTSSKKDSLLHLAYYDALQNLAIDDTSRIHYVEAGTAGAASYLRSGIKNVVIYMASREATVKDYITKFNKAGNKMDISMVGTEDWLEFNNVEADYYTNLNLHIPVATYADYSDSTRYYSFIKKYQSVVKADPSIYSFKGYKIGTDLIGRFLQSGEAITQCLDKIKPGEYLPFIFNFNRSSETQGWENQTIQILRVTDYQLEIINY